MPRNFTLADDLTLIDWRLSSLIGIRQAVSLRV